MASNDVIFQLVTESRQDIKILDGKLDNVIEKISHIDLGMQSYEERITALESRGETRIKKTNEFLTVIRNIGVIVAAIVTALWAIFNWMSK